MILRLSSSAARGSLVVLGLAFVSLFSYAGVRNALAIHDAGLQTLAGYEEAARLEPSDARNWYLLGRYWQYNLEDPDGQKAIVAYQKALSLNPQWADAWSDLAMAYESEGNLSAARDAFVRAQRAYPLSPEVAWRYGNFLLRRGETDAAFAEIKRAVQADPKRAAAAYSLSTRVEPDIHAILDRALPASQDAYLAVIAGLTDQQQTDKALVVWSRLVALHRHLNLGDSSALIEALLHKREVAQAQSVWEETLAAANLSRPADVPGSLVWDGGFESNIANVAFTWRYSSEANGVQVGLDTREKHAGNHSLRLTFNGLRNMDFHDVCQYIAVRPGAAYDFSAWVETHSLSTDQGVRFGLYSEGDTTNSIAWTDDVRGTQPWTQLRLAWAAAPDVRELYLCVSRIPSAQFDSKIHGFAWIDDVTLIPHPQESSTR